MVEERQLVRVFPMEFIGCRGFANFSELRVRLLAALSFAGRDDGILRFFRAAIARRKSTMVRWRSAKKKVCTFDLLQPTDIALLRTRPLTASTAFNADKPLSILLGSVASLAYRLRFLSSTTAARKKSLNTRRHV